MSKSRDFLWYISMESQSYSNSFQKQLKISQAGFKLSLQTLQTTKSILVIAIAKLQIMRKMRSSFPLKENLIHPQYSFPHYNHMIPTFYSSIAYYYQKKVLLNRIIKSQNAIDKKLLPTGG